MSGGFVGRAGPRITGRRLAAMVAVSVVACAIVAAVAPMIGLASDRAGWHLDLIGPSALAPGSFDHAILMVRLPRVLAAMLTGGALAAAGCALQALLRNPLAEPTTLGISSGASLGAVLAIRFGVERLLGEGGVGLGALVGAVLTLLAIWRLARVGRQLPPVTLILAGVAIAMFCSAVTIIIQYTSDFSDIERMLTWMMGGLDAVRLVDVELAVLPIFGALIVLISYAKEMNALAAGAEAAASVGVAVGRTQVVLFGVSSLLVGSAIAVVGPIGFIGLVVPHALRSLVGADHRALLATSIFGGAIVLAICDTLARIVVPSNHLPTGAVTAVLGVPFFFAILLANKRGAA
jgi:iron complex transport system permease protein